MGRDLFCSSSPGLRLNANRWAAVAWEQIFVWVRFAVLRVCSARRAVIQGEPPVLYWQTDAQKSQSGLFVLFGAHSWQPILAAHHCVATDTPVGAFKIRPILVKAYAMCRVRPLQGRG